MPDTSGWTVTEVAAEDNLQTAINNAAWNTILKLESGATFSGNFTLPYKAGWSAGKWIIIQSNTTLPAAGTRISPTTYGASLARIESNDSDPAIDVPNGTSDNAPRNYRLIGLEIGVKSTEAICFNLVTIGSKNSTDSNLPQNIIIDRCWIHGHDTGSDHRRGLADTGRNTALIDSYIAEIHSNSQAQAYWSYSTPGPLLVRNNYLSATGMSFFLGGATPAKEAHMPTDVTVQKNHMYKDPAWKAETPLPWQNLNSLEIKLGVRVLIEDNVFENSWSDAQTGWGIIIKAENQNNLAPYSAVKHLTLRFNHVKQVARGINMLSGANPNAGCKYFSVHDNLVECIGAANQWGEGDGDVMAWYVQAGNTQDIHIFHNTWVLDETAGGRDGIIVASGQAADFGFVCRDNILTESTYGVINSGESLATWANRLGGAEPDSCVWTGRSSAVYPNAANNYFPANNAAIQFENYANGCGGDYRLASGSPYKNAGTDGKDIGADIATLNVRISGVVQIESVAWDCGGLITDAAGSDLWPTTWADDDNQYTAWGDGWGFTLGGDKSSWGVARLAGAATSYVATDIFEETTQGSNYGKISGLISVAGVLYAIFARQSKGVGGTTIMSSDDYAASWSEEAWSFPGDGVTAPAVSSFLNFGKDNAWARDTYAYALGVIGSDEVHLLRVPSNEITTSGSWEYFTGTAASPSWNSVAGNSVAILTEAGNVGVLFPQVQYFVPLRRYVMTLHLAEDIGKWVMFEAPEPWGPWTEVVRYTDWCSLGGAQTEMLKRVIAPKWIDGAGEEFWMIYSCTGTYDRFNLVKGTFTLT
jgi:hypothetical protein